MKKARVIWKCTAACAVCAALLCGGCAADQQTRIGPLEIAGGLMFDLVQMWYDDQIEELEKEKAWKESGRP